MTRVESLIEYFKTCKVACVDSREVVPEALFFALKGNKVDGHAFLEQVKGRGAKGAVISEHYEGPTFGLHVFRVSNPLKMLQEMAKGVQRQRKAQIVGVTGSVGKTTTKEFIAHLLQERFKVGKNPGNANSQVGVPLTILNHLDGTEDIVVVEMGMTHPGNILRLVEMTPPDIALITAVHFVHAENFSSLHAIAQAKGEILTHSKTRLAVINKSLSHYPFAPIRTEYYTSEDALGGDHLPPHFKENLAAATIVARHFGLTDQEIRKHSETVQSIDKRFQMGLKKGVHFVNDAYNASEPSMIAALSYLPKTSGKIFAVLGEMLELGSFSEKCHINVGKEAVKYIDELFLVGDGCAPIQQIFEAAGKKTKIYPDGKSVLSDLKQKVKPGDVVLLKGSRFWRLWELEEVF